MQQTAEVNIRQETDTEIIIDELCDHSTSVLMYYCIIFTEAYGWGYRNHHWKAFLLIQNNCFQMIVHDVVGELVVSDAEKVDATK